jgi:hypothetical protein
MAKNVRLQGIAYGPEGGDMVAVDTGTPLPVSMAAGGADGFVAALKSGTATRSTVNSAASSATILAANTSRKGASIYNSDANTLYLDLSGGTAATTRCQYAIASGQTHEVPFGFTGLITGIWGADGSGLADVVEFT